MTGHRVPAGRVNGVHAELGTVLGPKVVTREFVVATGTDERGTTVGYATVQDVDPEAIAAMVERGPRSVTEFEMIRGYQVEDRLRLWSMFGRPGGAR